MTRLYKKVEAKPSSNYQNKRPFQSWNKEVFGKLKENLYKQSISPNFNLSKKMSIGVIARQKRRKY